MGIGIARVVVPDRDLLPGVEVDTDLGAFQVYETPGHAPSHVCLHQPERGVLISGDHLLGRVSLYYDYGWSPDPAGEFLASLDTVGELESSLCLAGHARPFRDVKEHVDANRREVRMRIERVRGALAGGAKTPFEIVPILLDDPIALGDDDQLGPVGDALLPALPRAPRGRRAGRGGAGRPSAGPWPAERRRATLCAWACARRIRIVSERWRRCGATTPPGG